MILDLRTLIHRAKTARLPDHVDMEVLLSTLATELEKRLPGLAPAAKERTGLMPAIDAVQAALTCATAAPCPREKACATLALFAMQVFKERGEWPPKAPAGRPPAPARLGSASAGLGRSMNFPRSSQPHTHDPQWRVRGHGRSGQRDDSLWGGRPRTSRYSSYGGHPALAQSGERVF